MNISTPTPDPAPLADELAAEFFPDSAGVIRAAVVTIPADFTETGTRTGSAWRAAVEVSGLGVELTLACDEEQTAITLVLTPEQWAALKGVEA